MFASCLICCKMLADIRQHAFSISLHLLHSLALFHFLERNQRSPFHLLLALDQHITEHAEMLVKFPPEILHLRIKLLKTNNRLPGILPELSGISLCNALDSALKNMIQFLEFLTIRLNLAVIFMTVFRPFFLKPGKCVFQFLSCNRLINICLHPKCQRTLCIGKFRISADYNKAGVRTVIFCCFDHGEAIQAWNPDIRNYHIRLLVPDHFKSLDTVIGSTYHFVIQLQAGKQSLNSLHNNIFIINYNQAIHEFPSLSQSV